MTATERFWAKVNKEAPVPEYAPHLGPCWFWTGAKSKVPLGAGYGHFHSGERQVKAHRFAYELLVGPIPEGLELDHLCRVRKCVNPAHLEPVTHAENIRRGYEAGAAEGHLKSHCVNGHAYMGENVLITGTPPRRVCRSCRRETARRLRKRVAS